MGIAAYNRASKVCRQLLDADTRAAQARQVHPGYSTAKPVPPQAGPTKREVSQWMNRNATDYDGATRLVEGAVAQFGIKAPDETHWLWDIAANLQD